MTTPKIRTVYMGGARWYVDPRTGEKVPGVTSIQGVLDKPALVGWAAKMTAAAAADKIAGFARIAEKNTEAAGVAVLDAAADRKALEDELKRARFRKSGDASERGENAHDTIEQIAKGELDPDGPLPPGGDWAARAVVQFREEFAAEPVTVDGLTMIEQTVWSERHGYAGSFDGMWKIGAFGGRNLLVDVKTSNGVYPETSLQLAAYRYADYVITPHGDTIGLPEIAGSAVLWVRPEGWALFPLRSDRVLDFEEGFLAARRLFDWKHEHAPKAVGDPVNANPLRKTRKR